MKYLKIIACTLFVVLLSGCGNKITTYDEINYTEYSGMIENKDTFILYIGSSNCSHCADFKPTLEFSGNKYCSKYKVPLSLYLR